MTRLIFNILFLTLAVLTLYGVYQASKFPRDFRIEASVDIEGDIDAVYQLTAISTNWSHWQPWRDADPKFNFYYDGPASGPGAQMQWMSKRRGNGLILWGDGRVYNKEEIARARVGREAVTVPWIIDVRNFGGNWNCVFQIQRDSVDDDLVHLTWVISGSRVPLERPFWFLFSLDEILRKDMEAGLSKIRALVESE